MENTGIMAVLEREVRKYIVLPKDSVVNVLEVNVVNGRVAASVYFVIGAGADVEKLPGAEARREIAAVDIDAVHTKRKYTRRAGQKTGAAAKTKLGSSGDGAGIDDLKSMKKNLRNWDAMGHLSENQVSAWTVLSHTNIHSMTDIQKQQMKDIFTDVRKKVVVRNG